MDYSDSFVSVSDGTFPVCCGCGAAASAALSCRLLKRVDVKWSSLTGRRRLSVCFCGVKCRAAATEEPLYAGSVSMEPAF